jgi:hypothetical protein
MISRIATAVLAVAEPWGTYIRVTDPEGRQLLANDRG